MEENRKRADWPIVTVVVLLLLLAALGGYVGAYFATSSLRVCVWLDRFPQPDEPAIYLREFRKKWQVKVFHPAVRLESFIRGTRVDPTWES